MKKILLSWFCLFILTGIVSAQQDTVLVFEGWLNTSPTTVQTIKPCLPKEERLSSNIGGVIKVECAAGITEKMQYCIKVAAQLWEEKLSIPKDILLRFEKERMGVDAADFAALVVYTSSPGTNMTHPQSYYMNFLTDNRRYERSDAVIKINEDVDWDYGFSDENTDKKNLTTAMLRAIAMSLGFGSTVCRNPVKGIMFTQPRYFSPFDNLIVNSKNVRLNEMPNNGRTNQELISYVTGDNVYYKSPNDLNLKLYAPSAYEEYNTLNYFDTNGDLMSYETKAGDKNQQIDEKTLEVIRAIGWKTVTNDLKIIATGIDDTGMASAFQSYSFHAETTSGSITNYSWKYELLNKEKEYITAGTGNTSVFTIDKVDDITKYDKNVNGDIKGKITLNATINAKSVTKVFYVYLAVKPTFISVKIDAITPIPGTKFYNLDLTVIYTGADYLYAVKTEEDSPVAITFYSYEPYISHLHFASVYMLGKAWVDLELNNKEGKATHTVTIPSQIIYVESDNKIEIEKDKIVDKKYADIAHITVKNIRNGEVIREVENYENLSDLPQGLYIFEITYKNGQVQSMKRIWQQ